MLRRSLRQFCQQVPFFKSGGLNKPIADVLKECRPLDDDEERLPFEKLLHSASIKTAGDWLHLSAEDKRELHTKAELPNPVIYSLNEAVRVGLLMPAFKFEERCRFLRATDSQFFNSSILDEATTVVQLADAVDVHWVLTRVECDALCHTYQRLVELTLKAALQGWRTEPTGADGKVEHYERRKTARKSASTS